MSGYDDQERLSQELHRRSHDVGGHPIGLDAVKGSARRIHRRRLAGGAVVAAAVLAVAVPTAFALTGPPTNGTGPAAQATASATVSDTSSASASTAPSESATPSSPTPNDGSVPLTLTDLTAGKSPNLPYLTLQAQANGAVTSTLHHDGVTDTFDGRYDNMVAYKGSWLAYGRGGSGPSISHLDQTGRLTSSAPGTDFAVSDDGTELAWVENGKLHSGLPSGHSEGELTQDLPTGVDATAVGFVQQGVVYSLAGTSPSVHLTDLNGKDQVVPGLIKSWGVSQSADLVGGETKVNSDGTTCWQVSRAKGDPLWSTCAWALGSFSPDGRYVVGTPSQADGLGSSRIALLDAGTGAVDATFVAGPADRQLFMRNFVWEDDTHLLAVAHGQPGWTVLRLGVDGSAERALPIVQGPDTDPIYHLSPR